MRTGPRRRRRPAGHARAGDGRACPRPGPVARRRARLRFDRRRPRALRRLLRRAPRRAGDLGGRTPAGGRRGAAAPNSYPPAAGVVAMTERHPVERLPFEYAVLRLVPRVDRGESINGGVLVYCRALDYLGAAVHVDPARLLALDPGVDVQHVTAVLDSIAETCGTDGEGPASAEEIGRRFRWLTAPRSTVVQAGPVHTGLTADPAAETQRLLEVLVLPVHPEGSR